ncbi:hypothetical protein POM88_038102 [Heracleum sosnowskyi]|uniref:Bulb-type lectin domain-containing protein n=1 Tax=Heracleum sosnowskyi TaxID=360622 RepID=A0AAD8HTX4_9APIA|nr:hypothetical protein POM88_038102 [Heracleum sosnowskyi]
MVMATSLKCCMLVVLLVLTSNSGVHVSAREGLYTNQALSAGDQLDSGAFTLVMQGDCNLVLLDTSVPVWSTGTNRRDSNCYAIMQGDRNLVIYKYGQGAVWASNTVRGNDKYALILQGDKNLVIYQGAARNAIWASNTLGSPQLVVDLGFPYSKDEFSFSPYSKIAGSANGIVCFLAYNDHPGKKYGFVHTTNIYLWNPATKQSKFIPPQTILREYNIGSYGFGFDPVDNDFKVLRSINYPFTTEVYSTNMNAWRMVGVGVGANKPDEKFLL